MYICVCKAVTDKQIRHALNNGIGTRKELFHCLGVGGECGKCNPHIKKMLAENASLGSIMPLPSEPAFNPV